MLNFTSMLLKNALQFIIKQTACTTVLARQLRFPYFLVFNKTTILYSTTATINLNSIINVIISVKFLGITIHTTITYNNNTYNY